MISGNVPAAIPPRIAAGAGPTDDPSLPRDSAELAPIAGANEARVPSGVLQRSFDRHRDPVSRSGVGVSERANVESLPRQLPDCSKFADVWHLLGEKFTPLCDFADGLATVSPGTATAESDFSLMKWEKNKFRSAQTDFSLEGILQYKQYEAILNHKSK
jgi:hypothetical protein